jgi:hypothetical protein
MENDLVGHGVQPLYGEWCTIRAGNSTRDRGVSLLMCSLTPYRSPIYPPKPWPKLRRHRLPRTWPISATLLAVLTTYATVALWVAHVAVLATVMNFHVPFGCGCLFLPISR